MGSSCGNSIQHTSCGDALLIERHIFSIQIVMDLSEDTITQILHQLPSKSLARFTCVSRSWAQQICDSSDINSCRSRRWKPCPRMIGLFYQPIDEHAAQTRFLVTSPSEVVKENFDESVDFLGATKLHIIASSKGFLLCCDHQTNQRHYYVYSPATGQYLALPETQTSFENVAIGFNCKVDDPNEDVISFTIVRYEIYGTRGLQSEVTIESFSSQTNAWTKITVDLGWDLDFHPNVMRPSKWLASAGAIDGVLFWLDEGGRRITAYDTVDKAFWCLAVPDMQGSGHMRFLGVSGGVLCYALSSFFSGCLTIWHLKSSARDRTARWATKYTKLGVVEAVESLGVEVSKRFYVPGMLFHPAKPHIVYNVYGKHRKYLICYDMESSSAEVLYDFGNCKTYANLFPYEWHEWPRLLY